MIKQKARGLVYFENKNIEDIKKVFENFRFDEGKFLFFKKIEINNIEKDSPGVFLNGDINEKYTSENIVRLFRKLMGLNTEMKNCDISVEKEDEIDPLTIDRKFKSLYFLKIAKEDVDKIKKLILEKLKVKYVLKTRDSGYQEGRPMISLDFFSEENIKNILDNIVEENKINYENKIFIEIYYF